MQTTRNRKHHGYPRSEETGEVSIATQEFRLLSDDGEEIWEPEIVLYLNEKRQLGMVRVVTPDGNTYSLAQLLEEK